MRDTDLVSIIRSHRKDSLGYDNGELSAERAAALDHYHGRAYGNELEGRSQVVSKDLSEAVDWAMPAILRVFVQSGNIAEFEPVNAQDEQLAQQESDVVNKVFMQDNNGFMLLHDACKDALLLKNGYIKHYWDETEESESTSYTGLTVEQISLLFTELEQEGAKVEIEGQEERQEFLETPQGPQPIAVFDVKIKATRKKGKVVCVPVPPEEIRVSRKCRGPLNESVFVEHVTRKTRTDLIEMGMPRGFVNTLPAYTEHDSNSETLARDSVTDESDNHGMSYNDKSMDEIEYCECYLKVDYDGDGIAELRKVVTVSDKIPPGEEWNEEIDCIPITGGVPKRIPHRHIGESLDDDINDLQEIKTTLLRQMLDNIYATNNNQWLVNERVNLADFLQSLPGGVKRVRGLEPIAGSVEPVMATPIMQAIMPAIDYIDATKESRTGINRATTGLDPDILKQSTKGAFLENLNRASQKIEMITRMLAETLVKPTLLAVHALLIKHQDKPMVTRLRGKFVEINPQEWKRRTDMILRVGIGTGNEEEKRSKLMILSQMQDRLMPMGLVGPQQGYSIFADMARAMGFDMPEKYALSPDSPEFQQKMQQPPPKPPQVLIEEMKLQADAQKFQAETQVQAQSEERKASLEVQKFQAQAEIDRRQAEQEMMREQQRSENDLMIEREKMIMEAELKKFEIEKKAEVDIAIAQYQAQIESQKYEREAIQRERDSERQAQMHKEKLDAMTKPKTIVRDESGRPAGIQ